MKIKVLPGTEADKILRDLEAKCQAANKACIEITKEVGGNGWVKGYDAAAGGLDGIQFETKPDGWKKLYDGKFKNIYIPRAIDKNKAIIKRLKELPVITDGDISNAVKFKPQSIGQIFSVRPAIKWAKDLVLIEITEGMKYKLLPGMVEITETEFNKLSKKK